MIIVQDKLVSDDIIAKQFMCNLKACKGACCWEGDFGAPLEDEEIEIIQSNYQKIKPFLTKEGRLAIREKGKYTYFEEPKENGTTLLKNGACAYMTYDNIGIAKCGIESAHKAGAIDFKKPISCHLYPIRINKDDLSNFEALNYDIWDICSAACKKGKEEQMPVYKFAKDALIRKYGEAFYEELDAAAKYLDKAQK
ncbi:MAG: hypothetical protein ACI8P3_000048 [Saprospiraceae bacterium]|jgi:hypothetical protein